MTGIIRQLQSIIPLKGPSDCGLCRQVVLVRRCIRIIKVAYGPAYSGLCIQVAPHIQVHYNH